MIKKFKKWRDTSVTLDSEMISLIIFCIWGIVSLIYLFW